MTTQGTRPSALLQAAVAAALLLRAAVSTAQNAAKSTARSGDARGVDLPNANVYALTSDNAIYVLRPGASQYVRLGRVETDGGNLIGIDFRPADNTPTKLY